MGMAIFRWIVGLICFCGLASPAHAQTVEYVHTDALGSVVAVTNGAGQVIERREYEPYGRQLKPTALADGPGYTGHVSDAATGLDYMQQRYYDPMIGRFLSVDPVGVSPINGINFNRYWYASNNPYTNTDPDGRCDGPTTCAIDRDIAAMNRGDMTQDEFMDRSQARAVGAAAGSAIVVAAIAGPEVAAALGIFGVKVAPSALAQANQIHHIFGRAKHGLEGVSKALGGDKKAMAALQKETNKAVDVSKPGKFDPVVVKIANENVTVTGHVVNGQARIGTAYVRPPPPPPPPPPPLPLPH